MDAHVEITVEHSDLHRTVWRFYYMPDGIVLDCWRDERRETKRHKFKSSQIDKTVWQRLDQRNNRIDQPEVPGSVQSAAIAAFRDSIKFADATDC